MQVETCLWNRFKPVYIFASSNLHISLEIQLSILVFILQYTFHYKRFKLVYIYASWNLFMKQVQTSLHLCKFKLAWKSWNIFAGPIQRTIQFSKDYNSPLLCAIAGFLPLFQWPHYWKISYFWVFLLFCSVLKILLSFWEKLLSFSKNSHFFEKFSVNLQIFTIKWTENANFWLETVKISEICVKTAKMCLKIAKIASVFSLLEVANF